MFKKQLTTVLILVSFSAVFIPCLLKYMDHTGHTDYSAAQPANSQSVPEENSRNILFTVKINDQFAVNLLSRILRYLICMICIVLLTVVSGKNPGTSRIQSAFYTQQFARIPVMALSIGGRAPPKSFR